MPQQTNTTTAILLLLLSLSTQAVRSQQIYLEQGENSSSFHFRNSEGEVLENLHANANSSMAIGYRNRLIKERLHFYFGAQYTSYGSIGSDSSTMNFVAWHVHYGGAEAGLDLKLFRLGKAVFYLKSGASASLLVKGYQLINAEVLNLQDQDDFQGPLIMFNTGAVIEFPIIKQLAAYAQYSRGKSLSLISNASNLTSQETLIINNEQLSFGLRFKLPTN